MPASLEVQDLEREMAASPLLVPRQPRVSGVRSFVRALQPSRCVRRVLLALVASCCIVAVVGKVGPTRALRGGDVCPGSPSLIHAKCKLSVAFEQPCAKVQALLEARIAAVHDCKTKPGTYKGGYRFGSRTTGDGKYTDLFKMSLAPTHEGKCLLTACSESQVTSVIDYSTNFCNLHNLYANSSALSFTERMDNCPQHDANACCR